MKKIYQATVVMQENTFALELDDSMSTREMNDAFISASETMDFSMKPYVSHLTDVTDKHVVPIKLIVPVI